MTAAEIVTARPITQVWIALGGDLPKHGRARAFYRKGDNHQAVSLNDTKGAWFDHRDCVGGGVLDLVQRACDCDRGTALRWLSEFAGLPLDDRPMTAVQRREYGRRRAAAEVEAKELIAWKCRLRNGLRAVRTRWWRAHHAARLHVLEQGLDSPLGDAMATLYELSEHYIEKLNRQVDVLDAASFADLVPVFRAFKAGRLAA